jgi:hypothetical protein
MSACPTDAGKGIINICEPLSMKIAGTNGQMHQRVIWGNKTVDNGFIVCQSALAGIQYSCDVFGKSCCLACISRISSALPLGLSG